MLLNALGDSKAKIDAFSKADEGLVIAERTMFPSTVSLYLGSDETETDFLAGLRESARYCIFETPEVPENREAELTD